MCNPTHRLLCPTPIKVHQSMWIQWLFFSKTLTKGQWPRMTFDPTLRSHVWLFLRIIVPKSHGNTSMYVDTVINFAKYTTYYILCTDLQNVYVQNEWSHGLILNKVQARQQLKSLFPKPLTSTPDLLLICIIDFLLQSK